MQAENNLEESSEFIETPTNIGRGMHLVEQQPGQGTLMIPLNRSMNIPGGMVNQTPTTGYGSRTLANLRSTLREAGSPVNSNPQVRTLRSGRELPYVQEEQNASNEETRREDSAED